MMLWGSERLLETMNWPFGEYCNITNLPNI